MKYTLVLAGLIIIGNLIGCEKQESTVKENNSESLVESTFPNKKNNFVNSEHLNDSPASSPQQAKIKPKDSMTNIQGIDFINDKTGWFIDNRLVTSSNIFRTEDGGDNWLHFKQDELFTNIGFTSRQEGWATAYSHCKVINHSPSCGEAHILHTKDGGKTWEHALDLIIDAKPLQDYAEIDFTSRSIGYVLINKHLYKTQDRGDTWKALSFKDKMFIPKQIAFHHKTGIVLGMKDKEVTVIHTKDGGVSWNTTFITDKEKSEYPRELAPIDITITDHHYAYLFYKNVTSFRSWIYASQNGGAKWELRNNLRGVRPTAQSLHFSNKHIGWIPYVSGAAGSWQGVMLTKDGGRNFKELPLNKMNLAYMDTGDPSQSWVVKTNELGPSGDKILYTNDLGKTWTTIFPEISPVTGIDFIDSDRGFGLGTTINSNDILFTSDRGKNWVKRSTLPEHYEIVDMDFVSKQKGMIIVKKDYKYLILLSKDGGRTWKEQTSNLNSLIYLRNPEEVNLTFLEDGTAALMSSSMLQTKIVVTRDDGNTWVNDTIKKHAEDSAKEGISFINSEEAWGYEFNKNNLKLYHWIDNKLDYIQPSIPATDVFDISFLSSDTGYILYQKNRDGSHTLALSKTMDGGDSWTSFSLPLEVYSDYELRFANNQEGWLLAPQGLYHTTDGGRTWE